MTYSGGNGAMLRRQARKTPSQDLLEACKAMLPLVRQHCSDIPTVDHVLRCAERAIARAEREDLLSGEVSSQQKKTFFGSVGKRYDFQVEVVNVQEKLWAYRLESRDRFGRRVVVRVKKDGDTPPMEVGESIFFRGKVRAHRAVFGMQTTYVEAISGAVVAMCLML
jgi:hypothetical protein